MTLEEIQAVEKMISYALTSAPEYITSDYMTSVSTKLLANILIELKLLNEKMDKVNGRKTT